MPTTAQITAAGRSSLTELPFGGVLNDTLSELLGEKIETIGASRTDAGLHALGNVAVFELRKQDSRRKDFLCFEPRHS